MRNIDAAFLYETGALVRPIKTLAPDTGYLAAYGILWSAKDAINGLLLNSIYSGAIRQPVKNSGLGLVSLIDDLMKKIIESDLSANLTQIEINPIRNSGLHFETLLLAEIQSLALYLVDSKGGFDISCLISEGYKLFPDNLLRRVPGAYLDVMAGSRCLAFELWTAMAFHFHRANEAVLREYFDVVAGEDKRPNIRTMGTMLAQMEKLNAGQPNIRAVLRSLADFHRNPIAHPGAIIENGDEAISLYAAIRAAMGYMLDKLPDADPAILSAILEVEQPNRLLEARD